MKNTLLLLAAVGVTATASAQSAVGGSGQITVNSGAGLTYTQDFNTLDDSTTSTTGGTTLPTGWYIFETGTSSSVDGKYRAGNGGTNTGDTYSFGTSSSSTDRALGSLASGSLTPHFGASFVNGTGGVITGAVITLKMEQWRVGDTSSNADTTSFAYSTTATGIDDTNASAMWMDVPAMMLTSVVTTPPGGGTMGVGIDGQTNSRNITATLTMNVPQGGKFHFRWKDKNIFGSDDGLSIDDMNIVFTTGPSAVNNVATNNLPLSLLGNGVSNDVKAAFTAPENGAYTLTVTDLAGRVVSSTEGAATKGQMIVAPVANQTLASGLYLVRVAQGTFSGVEKLSVR